VDDTAAEPWLDTEDFGVIDRLDSDEQIVTSFYRVLIPVWPESSAYVYKCADGSEHRIKIPLQRRSVVLGYLRVPIWLLAVIFSSPALLAPDRWGWLAVPALALVVLAAALTFVAGRLDDAEKLRRQLLRRVVGFGAPPELLSDALIAEVRSNLELMWRTRSPRTRWEVAIEHGEASELLVALAEYAMEPELLEQAHANISNKLWN